LPIFDCRLPIGPKSNVQSPKSTGKAQRLMHKSIGNWQSAIGNDFGDEREMESGLIFNQLICEFESRHPRQDIFDF
jgi:hypothetical protein